MLLNFKKLVTSLQVTCKCSFVDWYINIDPYLYIQIQIEGDRWIGSWNRMGGWMDDEWMMDG